MSNLRHKLQPWFDARKKFKLSHAQIQMARELGMNPSKFGSLANHRQEPWKIPLPDFIEQCYEKRFGRTAPPSVKTLEELIEPHAEKRMKQRQSKEQKKRSETQAQRGALPEASASSAAPLLGGRE